MASVGKDSKGYRVRFVMPDGTNKTIRFSGFEKSTVEEFARHIAELVSAKAGNSAFVTCVSSRLDARAGERLLPVIVSFEKFNSPAFTSVFPSLQFPSRSGSVKSGMKSRRPNACGPKYRNVGRQSEG